MNTLKSTSKPSRNRNANLSVKMRILLADEIAFGSGKAELLEAIKTTGSISAAGRPMNMSYRRAWLLVDSMNRCFQLPLVESSKGGKNGGGAQVTSAGDEVLSLYRIMNAAVNEVSAAHFKNLVPLLRKTPLPPTAE